MAYLNFSWVLEGSLAAAQGPTSRRDLIFLKLQDIRSIVRMEERTISGEALELEDLYEPVPDYTAPNLDQIHRMVTFIEAEIETWEHPVVVTCQAGLGRTGTVLASYLVYVGYKPEDAMKLIRELRPGSIETADQEDAIKRYHEHLQAQERERTKTDPVEWTHEAFARLKAVPLIARPLARNTVEKFTREHGMWRVTTMVMDENKQAMIDADTFDIDTMLVMFKELQTKQIQAAAEGVDGLTPEMRKFIEEAKASGVTRCPIRDMEAKAEKCPVEFKTATPEEAKRAVEQFMADSD